MVDPTKRIQIVSGKFYRTRNGRKVRIYSTDGSRARPIHGAVLCDGEWVSYSWTADGSFDYSGLVHRPSPFDLVGEWSAPVRVQAWIDDTTGQVIFLRGDFKLAQKGYRRASWLDEPVLDN